MKTTNAVPSEGSGRNEMNAARVLVSMLRDICAARQIELVSFSDDWILLLQKDGRSTHVIGYDFALNSATAKMLCKDKSATSDILHRLGVPRIEHRIFHGPQMRGYVPMHGNWREMLRYFEACGGDVVCKPNEGTGGRNVMRARSEPDLEAAVMEIFTRHRALCLSPFEQIDAEFRVAVLEDEVQFVYRKERASLTADGQRSLRELLINRLRGASTFAADIEAVAQMAKEGTNFNVVPKAGEQVVLNWRHNLGQGAAPKLYDLAAPETQPLCELALRAARALNVKVASVDVVNTAAGLKVLEINSGIMMENLVRSFSFGPEVARKFYDRIVCRALGLT